MGDKDADSAALCRRAESTTLTNFSLLVRFQRLKFTIGFLTDLTLSKDMAKDHISPVEPVSDSAADEEKVTQSVTPSEKVNDNATFTANAQAGVKRVEAATIVWTKWHLIGAYAM